jgi:hypothetical protein
MTQQQHSAAVLAGAVPTIRRAIARFEGNGDRYQAGLARQALAVCLAPPARTFADPPPATTSLPGATQPDDEATLAGAIDHLKMQFAKAKERGDDETAARIEDLLRRLGSPPTMPALGVEKAGGQTFSDRPVRHRYPRRPLAASERAMLAKAPMGRQVVAEYT